MMGPFHRLCRCFRLLRSAIIATLISVNLIMAVYTIPILVGGRRGVNVDMDVVGRSLDKDINRLSVYNNSLPHVMYESSAGDYAHEFLYMLQPKTGCEEDVAFLLIIVCSAVHHFDLRQAIRATWASSIHKNKLSTKLVFMLGAPSGEYQHLEHQVIKESAKFGDVIQEDFVDSYVNLTLKSIAVLKWATVFCQDVKYVVKTDDDVFINIANLVTLLMDVSTSQITTRFMLGSLIKDAKPITNRHSKWFSATTLFKDKTYPNYLSGSAYVISGDVIIDLYSAATTQKPFWLEDIFITGILAADNDIRLLHNPKFTYRRPKMPHPCFYKSVVTAHELSADSLRHIWNVMVKDDQDCSKYSLPT